MTYAEKLRDPRWQRKRLEVMQRDNFCCTWCGNGEVTLNVHHHYYTKGKSPWDYDDSALTTLCEDCHQDIERKKLELLKCITWEVPFESIYRLATQVDPFLLADFALACDGDAKPNGLNTRRRTAQKIIDKMQEFISGIDEIKSVYDESRMSSFDKLIDDAPIERSCY